jgi:hypothetical protein
MHEVGVEKEVQGTDVEVIPDFGLVPGEENGLRRPLITRTDLSL